MLAEPDERGHWSQPPADHPRPGFASVGLTVDFTRRAGASANLDGGGGTDAVFLIAFVGAAIIALVLWKAMNSSRSDAPLAARPAAPEPVRPRVSGPDDDPDFLRQLDEKVKRRDDPPA